VDDLSQRSDQQKQGLKKSSRSLLQTPNEFLAQSSFTTNAQKNKASKNTPQKPASYDPINGEASFSYYFFKVGKILAERGRG
jgi:hypothetical protein